MALRLYNTLTQSVQPFAPMADNTVRMYTCGPTVYDFAHIGNFRTFVFYDLLRRWLRADGFKLNHVMNLTDVDDRIIQNAAAEHVKIREYTEKYVQAFLEDMKALSLETPERVVRATDHIDDMVSLMVAQRRGEFRPRLRFLAPGKKILQDARLDLDALIDWISEHHSTGRP